MMKKINNYISILLGLTALLVVIVCHSNTIAAASDDNTPETVGQINQSINTNSVVQLDKTVRNHLIDQIIQAQTEARPTNYIGKDSGISYKDPKAVKHTVNAPERVSIPIVPMDNKSYGYVPLGLIESERCDYQTLPNGDHLLHLKVCFGDPEITDLVTSNVYLDGELHSDSENNPVERLRPIPIRSARLYARVNGTELATSPLIPISNSIDVDLVSKTVDFSQCSDEIKYFIEFETVVQTFDYVSVVAKTDMNGASDLLDSIFDGQITVYASDTTISKLVKLIVDSTHIDVTTVGHSPRVDEFYREVCSRLESFLIDNIDVTDYDYDSHTMPNVDSPMVTVIDVLDDEYVAGTGVVTNTATLNKDGQKRRIQRSEIKRENLPHNLRCLSQNAIQNSLKRAYEEFLRDVTGLETRTFIMPVSTSGKFMDEFEAMTQAKVKAAAERYSALTEKMAVKKQYLDRIQALNTLLRQQNRKIVNRTMSSTKTNAAAFVQRYLLDMDWKAVQMHLGRYQSESIHAVPSANELKTNDIIDVLNQINILLPDLLPDVQMPPVEDLSKKTTLEQARFLCQMLNSQHKSDSCSTEQLQMWIDALQSLYKASQACLFNL